MTSVCTHSNGSRKKTTMDLCIVVSQRTMSLALTLTFLMTSQNPNPTQNVDCMRHGGYPDYVIDGDCLVGLLPWHERQLKTKVYHMKRHELQDHVLGPHKSTTPMYGIYIDVDR